MRAACRSTGCAGAYIAVTAAEAVQAARRLGTHISRGSEPSVRSTALGAVAACTSMVGAPWPWVA
ncbi:hypothetical protein SALBM311S_02805 [Streptomyces alboniger]